MKKFIISILLGIIAFPAFSQEILTLEKCKELALKNNFQVKNAELSVEIAKQHKKEAFTKYFPSISATGVGFTANKPMLSMEMDISAMISPMMQTLTPTMIWLAQHGALDPAILQGLSQPAEPIKIEALKNGILAGAMAIQPIFAGGQIVNGNRLAKAGVEVRQLQKQMTDNEVLLTTERYFWQIVSMKEKMKTIENSEAMLDRILLDVKGAIEAGLTTRNDLLRVELEKNRLENGRLKVENGLMILKMILGQHIGMTADSFDIQTPEFNVIHVPLANNNDAAWLQNRPEYKLLEKSVDIAKMQVNMEIGKNMPTIAIGAGYQYMNFDLHKDNGMKNDLGMVFATVSVPITDWWGGAHAIKRKKLEYQATENTQQEKVDLLVLQMQQIHNEVNEAYQQVILSQKSISVAEENLKISQDTYNAGITTLSDLLEAQTLLQQSRDQYTEAATGYYLKMSEYKQVTGGLPTSK
jgi:outer membrane protein TolC